MEYLNVNGEHQYQSHDTVQHNGSVVSKAYYGIAVRPFSKKIADILQQQLKPTVSGSCYHFSL